MQKLILKNLIVKDVPWYRRFLVYEEATCEPGMTWNCANITEALIGFLQGKPVKIYGIILHGQLPKYK